MPDVRVDNAQRAEVLERLTRALDARSIELDEYDRRVAAVAVASTLAQLADQIRDLPPEYGWAPHVAAPVVGAQRAGPAYGRIALVLGVVSVPLSACGVGAVFGILAVLYSRRGAGARGFGPALLGRVFGVIGVVLSAAAVFAMWFAFTHRAS